MFVYDKLSIHTTVWINVRCISTDCTAGFYLCDILEKQKENRSAVGKGWGQRRGMSIKGPEGIESGLWIFTLIVMVIS